MIYEKLSNVLHSVSKYNGSSGAGSSSGGGGSFI